MWVVRETRTEWVPQLHISAWVKREHRSNSGGFLLDPPKQPLSVKF
jgi:hypothetical protein